MGVQPAFDFSDGWVGIVVMFLPILPAKIRDKLLIAIAFSIKNKIPLFFLP